MIPLAILLVWAGYGIGSWGYELVKGHDVTLREWFSPLHPYSGPWPPKGIPATQIFPGGKPAKAAAGGASGSGSGPPGIGSRPPKGKPCPPGTTKTLDGRCVPIPHV